MSDDPTPHVSGIPRPSPPSTVGAGRRLARWVIGLLAVAAVASVSSCATILYAVSRSTPPAPLTRDLTGRFGGDVNPAFEQRVRAAFPIGSPAKTMEAELLRQGFLPVGWTPNAAGEYTAERVEESFVCRQSAYIHWKMDAQGLITAIRAGIPGPVCL